jgi:hypothetical protein
MFFREKFQNFGKKIRFLEKNIRILPKKNFFEKKYDFFGKKLHDKFFSSFFPLDWQTLKRNI